MSIRRGPRLETRFYTLNKSISEDGRLSWAARGVLIFLLGKPDNWEVSVKHLINQTAEAIGKSSGRDAVRVILKELEQAGYLVADVARSEGGAFNGMAYTVCEIPEPKTETPGPDNPAPGKPAPANPPLTSNDLNQDNELEEETNKTLVSSIAEVFDHWRVKMGSPRSKLDNNRKTLITNALKNYTIDDLKQAVDGCAASPYHMGTNDRNTKYNGLDLILRNAEKIESFMSKAVNRPVAPKHTGITKDFSNSTYQSTPDDQFADFLQ